MLAVAMGKDEIMKYIDDMVRGGLDTCSYYCYGYHHHYQLNLLLLYDDLCVC